MIEIEDQAKEAVESGSFQYQMRVDVYFNGKLLYSGVPVSEGFEEINSYNDVDGRAEFRLPRICANGFDWSPKYTSHPLANNGQRILVTLGVGTQGQEPDWFRRSWWRIIETTTEGDEVVVQCGDLMWIVAEADFSGPFQPSGTFASTVRELVQPEVNVLIDDGLTDRSIPSSLEFGQSRIQALQDTLDAWPAEPFMGENNYLTIRPLLESRTSLLTLTHGVGGTVIESSGSNNSEDAWNCVVVRGKDDDGTIIQAVAYNTDSKHPKAYGGPFSRLPIPRFFDNDLIDTYTRAKASANAILARLKKRNDTNYSITMIPNPTLQIGDVITITTNEVANQLVEITQLRLPYTHDGGPMSLTVRVI